MRRPALTFAPLVLMVAVGVQAVVAQPTPSVVEASVFADSLAVQHARYAADVAAAEALYADGANAESAARYAEAFRHVAEPSDTDLYNAACAAALAGEVGRAFGFLHRSVEAGWEDEAWMREDPDLDTLRAYSGLWTELAPAVERSKERRYGAAYDPALVAELEAIRERDQGIRAEWTAIQERYGFPIPDSVEVPFKERWRRVDAEVLAEVEALIIEHGWLGQSLAGKQGAQTAFLVIQHAPLAVQEHYLPVLERAVAEGESEPWHLAFLTDRVRMRQGEGQVYGTQMRLDEATGVLTFFPIEDEAGVDARRASVGLGTLAEYARQSGFEYAPPEGQ